MNPIQFLKHIWNLLRSKPQTPPSLQDNELLKVILNRRSIRGFTNVEIEDDIFNAILEAGRLAPCTVNMQTWTFATFTHDTWRTSFGSPLPFHARRAVIILGDTHRAKQVLDVLGESPLLEYTLAVMNASLASMNMNLAAEALGVSSVMLSETGKTGFLDALYLKEKLELPDGVFPLMTIVFGYARKAYPPMPPKLGLEQLCIYDRYIETERAVMQDWFDQMDAGYKLINPFSSFQEQIIHYQGKFSAAEETLQKLVYYRHGDSPKP